MGFGHVEIGRMNWYDVAAKYVQYTNSTNFYVFIGNAI